MIERNKLTPLRFIPTCVGNTKSNVEDDEKPFGSSPRVWGILPEFFFCYTLIRFIPTCVGNTSGSDSPLNRTPVHPHVCGEYWLLQNQAIDLGGSSPRVWGIRSQTRRGGSCRRFIPTCVGNTALAVGGSFSLSVHPHVCGEYSPIQFGISPPFGSSPRVWGIPLFFRKKEI